MKIVKKGIMALVLTLVMVFLEIAVPVLGEPASRTSASEAAKMEKGSDSLTAANMRKEAELWNGGEVRTTNAITCTDSEDWSTEKTKASVFYEGTKDSLKAGCKVSYKMTISKDEYKTLGTDGYLKTQAVVQQEADWNEATVVKMGWPMYTAADFAADGDSYSVKVEFTMDKDADIFYSLLIDTVGTKFKGDIDISDVIISGDEKDPSAGYVEITAKADANGDVADISKMADSVKLVDSNATDETKALAAYLSGLRKSGQVLFGHQNSTFRSVRTNGVTSDIKDITGAEPGIFGIDTLALASGEGTTEGGAKERLDFSIEASLKAYNEGSIITLSCHMPNFTNGKITATGNEEFPYDFTSCDFGESQDLSACADYILDGGKYNPQFNAYLDIIVKYAAALQEKGIPIMFRPFHENSGGWFWWGTSTSVESYKAMWQYMVNYLEDKGIHNLLYVYSPNGPISSKAQYLERYPGDAYVDILGFDYYDDYADAEKYTGDNFFSALADSCDIVSALADEKNKIPAIAETGIRITGKGKNSLMVSGNPTKDKDWYNNVINTAAAHDIPYFLIWANFDTSNFFVPYKYTDTLGQEMINDFISAYNNDKSIFGNGTNFYTTGDKAASGAAVSKADGVKLTGYSGETGGYITSHKNYDVIKKACTFTAAVRNAGKVQFKIMKGKKTVLTLTAKNSGQNVYTAKLSKKKLSKIGKTSTGVVVLLADGKELGSIKYINFNKNPDVLKKTVFDNFEYYYGNDELLQSKYGAANSADGCDSSMTLNKKNKVEGKYSGVFNYTLNYKNSEVWTGGLGRVFDKGKTDFSKYNAVSMWVKPDGNGQKMVIQLNDEYEAYLSDFVKGKKARYITIPFSSFIKKGGTEAIDSKNITGFKLWCNSIPENYKGKKNDDGSYKVSSKIIFDDIKVVKIKKSDLKKADENGIIITKKPLSGR